MIRILCLALFLTSAAAPQLRAAADNELCPGLGRQSAAVFLDSITYELKKNPALKPALEAVKPGAAELLGAQAGSEGKLTQAGLFNKVAALVPITHLNAADKEAAQRALNEARAYIAPEDLPACRQEAPRSPRAPPADLKIYPDGSPETAATDPGLLEWKDSAGYAASRIGPLCAVLDTLGPGDAIVLSNLTPSELPENLVKGKESISLHLPVSGYAKKLSLIRSGSRKTLLITDFQGAAFLRHFELLIKRYYSGKRAPKVTVAESSSEYEPYYKALARVNEENPGKLAGLAGLISGYAETFRLSWSSYAVTSVLDGKGDWRVDTYRLPGAGLWGVMSAHSPYYGETLGANIRYLVEESTGIKTVVLAGSGGSLDPRPLYGITYPSEVITPGGEVVPNALGSIADLRAHTSVLSPLEETPKWLAAARAEGISTVDVEMGPAAQQLSGLGLRLGFAVLVTDYPIHLPVIEKLLRHASLGSQDSGAKYRRLSDYAEGLRAWIGGAPAPGWQPIEKKMGRPLAEQSALNIAAQAAALEPLNPEENALQEKLQTYFIESPPSFSIRMSTWRAVRVLEDQALLSTALVSSLKGSEVKPFTPGYEDLSYGAYEYIFGTLSYWDGPEKYGAAVIRLKPGVWKTRAWATRRSAMRALAIYAQEAGVSVEQAARKPELYKKAENLFESWIVMPADLPRALALQIIGELRQAPPEAFRDFSAATPMEIPGLIARYDVGWLEGKIRGCARMEDIDLLKAPAPIPALISGPAARLGITTVPSGPLAAPNP